MKQIFDYIKLGVGFYIGYRITQEVDNMLGTKIVQSEKYQQIKDILFKNTPANDVDIKRKIGF